MFSGFIKFYFCRVLCHKTICKISMQFRQRYYLDEYRIIYNSKYTVIFSVTVSFANVYLDKGYRKQSFKKNTMNKKYITLKTIFNYYFLYK